MKIGLLLVIVVLLGGSSVLRAVPSVSWETPPERYTQTLEIAMSSPEAAQNASVKLLPLYDGYEWAISSRWDDNNPADLKMHAVLARYGMKGTWYLNDPRRGRGGGFVSTARKLLEGGHSIGAHSLTHPVLTGCSRNRIFEEIAAVRVAWEAALDIPVTSYAFSFCNFRNRVDPDAVHMDIVLALERAGLYNIANAAFDNKVKNEMILSPILPDDGADVDPMFERSLKDRNFQEKHPNLSFAMHALRYERNNLWGVLTAQFEKYARNPDWWYCNQNQYAGYRYQFLRSQLSEPTVDGNVLRITLTRPLLLEVNDATPLSVRVNGIDPEEVVSVSCDTVDIERSTRQPEAAVFHLHHDGPQQLPEKIALVKNTDNRSELTAADEDSDFPKVRALLHLKGEALQLILKNASDAPLENVRIRYRLPLGYTADDIRETIAEVPSGASKTTTLPLTKAQQGYKYHSGLGYFLAQVDFVQGGTAGRIHATVHVKNEQIDPSFPQNGFIVCGPITAKEFDARRLQSMLALNDIMLAPYRLDNDDLVKWDYEEGTFKVPYLDPEIVRTTGSWRSTESQVYLLQSTIQSTTERDVSLRFFKVNTEKVYLNGIDVTDGKAKLKTGDNNLFVIYYTTHGRPRGYKYNTENAGWFFRIEDPEGKQRITDVRYEAPHLFVR